MATKKEEVKKEDIKKLSTDERLSKIQCELNAPKNRKNNFGNYSYRSCEDIMEGLKPLIKKYGGRLLVSDDIVQVGDRYYIEATASYDDIKVTAYARESESKKGMDSSQITGATSSYARKYALNGLFLIDDNKDFDTNERHDNTDVDEYEKQKDDTISKDMEKKLDSLIQRLGRNKKKLLSTYEISSLSELTNKQYVEVFQLLQKFEEKKKQGEEEEEYINQEAFNYEPIEEPNF